MMLIIFIVSLIVFNVINAYFDAYRFVKHKTVAHGINFGIYAVIIIVQMYLSDYAWWYMVLYCFAAFCNRQVTFDIPLNWRRNLKWWYVSLDKPPKAITDRVEIYVFGYNGKAITTTYIVGAIIFTTLLFLLWH